MVKKYSMKNVVLAFLITFFFFAGGFFVSNVYNDAKIKVIKEDYSSLTRQIESLQLEEQYLEVMPEENKCELMNYQVTKLGENLHLMGERLIAYEASKEFNDQFEELRRDYALLQIRGWLRTIDAKKTCGLDVVPIMYLYENKCDSCEEQGYTISYYKDLLKERLMVFSLDKNLDLPIIQLMNKDFDVQQTPVVVIDKDVYGYLDKNNLKEKICESYKKKPTLCN